AEHFWVEAEEGYRTLQEQDPDQPQVLLGLVKALLAQAKSAQALFILNAFPASKEYHAAQVLRPLAEAMVKQEKNEMPGETDLDAMFSNSIRLVCRKNHLAALDGLLDLLRQDKHYRNDRARQVFLAILEVLGAGDEDVRQYRSELAMILF
ncbi:MAG: tetratricopeptide repeat protein, partial [Anaerolineaceae bacterium]|nr:tetratricopeptide repeat protein [Anaerolineaceae bacterium]